MSALIVCSVVFVNHKQDEVTSQSVRGIGLEKQSVRPVGNRRRSSFGAEDDRFYGAYFIRLPLSSTCQLVRI